MTPQQVENYYQGLDNTDTLFNLILESLINYDNNGKPQGFKVLQQDAKDAIEKQSGEILTKTLSDCFGWDLSIIFMQEYLGGVVDMGLELDEKSKLGVLGAHNML